MNERSNSLLVFTSTAVSMILLAALALLVPQDVISRHGLLQSYTAVCRGVIPGIERLAAVSSFPQVTILVVSVMWTLVPVSTGVYLFRMHGAGQFVEQFRKKLFFGTFCACVVALSIVLLAVLYDITPGDLEGRLINENVLHAVSTSRMGLGLVAGFFLSGVALLLFMVLLWLLNVRNIYFPVSRP